MAFLVMELASMNCELCYPPKGTILYQNDFLYITLVDELAFPGFCRVIWKQHVAEMSDLPPEHRALLMRWVCSTEEVVRRVIQPDKINLASLGNVVPHLHWHVIPRFHNDSHFPAPIWAKATRAVPARDFPDLVASLTAGLAAYTCADD